MGSIITAKIGGSWTEWHMRLGYFALALLLFRIGWGIVGSRTSRFTDFLRGPTEIKRYIRTGKSPTVGHNPLGGLSVIAMIISLLVQATTGLFVDDEIATQGPLASKVSSRWVSLATTIHHTNEKVIFALIALHIFAVFYYAFRKHQPLISAMLFGKRTVVAGVQQPIFAPTWLAVLLITVAGGFVYWLVS
jgi:cytochrome b